MTYQLTAGIHINKLVILHTLHSFKEFHFLCYNLLWYDFMFFHDVPCADYCLYFFQVYLSHFIEIYLTLKFTLLDVQATMAADALVSVFLLDEYGNFEVDSEGHALVQRIGLLDTFMYATC